MQCTEQLLMPCFACALAVAWRAILISSVAAATLDWIQQHRVRSQLKPCWYQPQLLGFQRALELGLTLRRNVKLKSAVKKKKKKTVPSRECFFFSFFCFCTSERDGFCSPYHRKPNCFFCLPAWCLISSDFTSWLSRWGPTAEWSWTSPAVSRHNRLSPISLAVHMKSNHQKD